MGGGGLSSTVKEVFFFFYFMALFYAYFECDVTKSSPNIGLKDKVELSKIFKRTNPEGFGLSPKTLNLNTLVIWPENPQTNGVSS